MSIDITALDLLPAEAKGLWPCGGITCNVSCITTCKDTERK
ncbi:ALQxL family class IV lanthipeptide [Nonomuraea sp. NPDC048826]